MTEQVKDKKKKKDEQKEQEEQEFLAYADGSLDGMDELMPDPEFETGYWKERLEQVRAEFRTLVMQGTEADRIGSEEMQNAVMKAKRRNWKTHKEVIKELQKRGIKVNHPFGIL